MKEMHRLMVTSNAYRLASYGDKELVKTNLEADPANTLPLALPPAAPGSRADLGFDPHRRRQPGHDRRRPSFDIAAPAPAPVAAVAAAAGGKRRRTAAAPT